MARPKKSEQKKESGSEKLTQKVEEVVKPEAIEEKPIEQKVEIQEVIEEKPIEPEVSHKIEVIVKTNKISREAKYSIINYLIDGFNPFDSLKKVLKKELITQEQYEDCRFGVRKSSDLVYKIIEE